MTPQDKIKELEVRIDKTRNWEDKKYYSSVLEGFKQGCLAQIDEIQQKIKELLAVSNTHKEVVKNTLDFLNEKKKELEGQ